MPRLSWAHPAKVSSTCRSGTLFFRSSSTRFHTGLLLKPTYGPANLARTVQCRIQASNRSVCCPDQTGILGMQCTLLNPSWGFNAVDVGTSFSSCLATHQKIFLSVIIENQQMFCASITTSPNSLGSYLNRSNPEGLHELLSLSGFGYERLDPRFKR